MVLPFRMETSPLLLIKKSNYSFKRCFWPKRRNSCFVYKKKKKSASIWNSNCRWSRTKRIRPRRIHQKWGEGLYSSKFCTSLNGLTVCRLVVDEYEKTVRQLIGKSLFIRNLFGIPKPDFRFSWKGQTKASSFWPWVWTSTKGTRSGRNFFIDWMNADA